MNCPACGQPEAECRRHSPVTDPDGYAAGGFPLRYWSGGGLPPMCDHHLLPVANASAGVVLGRTLTSMDEVAEVFNSQFPDEEITSSEEGACAACDDPERWAEVEPQLTELAKELHATHTATRTATITTHQSLN